MGSKGSKGSSTQAQTQNQNQQQFQTQAQDQATQSQTNTAQQQALTQAQQTAQQTAQNQQGQSTYNANPLIGGAAGQALTQAQQAAQTPFNLPVAPVAGFTPDQLQAFQQTQQQQGIAQPYYNQAQDLYNQSAAPISGAQISQYMNPYASSVMANLQESQGQQMNDVTGRLTQQAGGVGGSRIGVAQAELARQQNLATGQTMAGIYGSALSAAQQDAQRQQAAAYGVGNLGGAAQNAAMQGTQALLGTGSLQQQQQQAQLNAPYQNQLAQLALPYQQAQYLAGITGGLSGALGGTTNTNQTGTGSTTGQMTGTSLGNTTGQTTGSTNSQGQSVGYGQTIGNMNANTVNTPAQPSWLSQLAGLGTAGAGLYGALGKGSDTGGGAAYQNSTGGYNGMTDAQQDAAQDAGLLRARGGRTGYAEGGDTSDTTGDASWMGSDPTVPKVEIQSSHAEHAPVPALDVSPHSGFVPMATPPSVPTPAAPKNDPIVPMQMKTLNMTPIQPQSSGSGGSSFLGDLASVAKTAATIIPLLAQGGAVSAATPYQSFDDGGDVASISDTDTGDFGAGNPTEAERMRGIALLKMAKEAGAKEAQSDSPVGNIPPKPDFANAFAPSAKMGEMPTDQAAGYLGAVRTDPAADDRWRRGVNVQQNQKEIVPDGPRRVSVQMPDNSQAPPAPEPKATGLAAISPAAAALAEKNKKDMMGNPYGVYDTPYPDLNHKEDVSRNFARSPWMALIAAGAGMMGGSSPYAGVNIGKGLTSGVEYLDKQRTASREEETVNQRAKQLGLQADKFLREYTQLTPAELIGAEQKQSVIDQGKWQMVYDSNNGKAYWTKPGEASVPAIQGAGPPSGAPSTPPAPAVPPVGANAPAGAPPATAPAVPNAPLAGNQPVATPGQFAYKPPSEDPTTGPGAIFNPKTGNLSPEQAQITREAVVDASQKSRATADAALQLGHLKQAFGQLDSLEKEAGGLLKTGAYAQQRFAIAKTINGVLAPLGIEPIDPKLIGSAEEAQKITTRLGQAQARLLGAREAAQVVNQSIEANPGINNTPEGRRYILSTMDASIQRQVDYSRFVNDYVKRWRTAQGADTQFNLQNPPDKYVAQAGVNSAPEQFRNPAALNSAIAHLRAAPNDPKVVSLFNKIYHGTASYFLKNDMTP